MTYKDAIAALMGDDEEKKEAAKSAIKAAFGEEEGEKKPDDAEEKKDAKASDDAEEKKDSEGEDEEEKKKAADDESKKDTVAASLDAKAIEKLVDAKLRVISETAERDRLLASRKDVGEKMLAALKSEPLAHVRKMLDAMPVTAKRNPAGDTSVKATRGDGQGEEAARLDASEKAKLDERMGLTSRKTCIEHVKNKSFFHAMTRDNAQRVLAAKGGK